MASMMKNMTHFIVKTHQMKFLDPQITTITKIFDDINNDDEISQEGEETMESENVEAPDEVVLWSSSSQQFSPRFCIPDEAA